MTQGEGPAPEKRLVELARSSWDVLTRMAVALERQAVASEKILALLERRPAAGTSPAPAGAAGTPNSSGRQPDPSLKIRFGKNKGQLVTDLETKHVRSAAHFIAETWFQSDQYRDANLKQLEEINLHLAARGSPRIDPEPEGSRAPSGPRSSSTPEEPDQSGAPGQDDIPF